MPKFNALTAGQKVFAFIGDVLFTAVKWAATILFGVAVVVAIVWLIHFATNRPVERPPSVETLVTQLRKTGIIDALDVSPYSCSSVPKGVSRYRCFYEAGDAEVLVVWHKRSGRPSALIVNKTRSAGAEPFTGFDWPRLSDAVSLLCRDIDFDQARAVVREATERLSKAAWYLKGEPVAADSVGASRRAMITPTAGCSFTFSENMVGRTIRSELRASPINPRPMH